MAVGEANTARSITSSPPLNPIEMAIARTIMGIRISFPPSIHTSLFAFSFTEGRLMDVPRIISPSGVATEEMALRVLSIGTGNLIPVSSATAPSTQARIS